LRWRGGDWAAALRDCLERELAERAGFHWLAVAFATGCLAYFALPREPLLLPQLSGAIVAAAIAARSYRRGAGWQVAAIVAVCLAGSSAAKFRVDTVITPHIERPLSARIEGRVLDRESRAERRPRIVLDEVRSDTIASEGVPERVRVTLSERYGLPPLGARIAAQVRLMPVAGPVVPGGYDPRRAAFFEKIGSSGFMLGGWQLVEPPENLSADLAIARIRAAIVERIMAAEPGEAGAVAAALLVGERSALSEETNESLRLSGLAHILSISGLHMMLIAGTAFFAVRALLALSPRLVLAQPIRKWAALAALLVVSIYFALSGGGAATIRAYVMAVIMFAAILMDRSAISMRNLAIAAFIVLALEPENVAEPGFQMSFAAVAALIAGWEFWSERRRRRLTDDDALPGLQLARFVGRAAMAVAATTLIAGLATAPFAAYHFERVATYSLLGNLLAAPLVSAIIMPFGLLSLVAMPFGLESLPLAVMARGIELLLAISDWVAGLPGADLPAPRMAPASLLLIAAGMLWLCLWRLRWRLLGLPAIGLGVLLIPVLSDPPDIMVSPDGRAVAVRDASGVLRVSGARAGSYVVEQFFDEEPGPALEGQALREGVRCDESACALIGASGIAISHVLDPAAFPEDCRRAQIVVTPHSAPVDCRAPLVVDAPRLQRLGAHAVRITEGAADPVFAVATERSAFPRPWQAGGAAAQ
jgi:competence protein ComEC